MTELEAKVEALKALISFKLSGRCLCIHSEKLGEEILALSEQIRKEQP
jgi:hypothetical protein